MSEKMTFENYESKGRVGLELRMSITDPIYDYIGKFKYDEGTGIKVATAIRTEYLNDKIYHVICTIDYDGIEELKGLYDNVYYDIIIDNIVVVEKDGKKGLYDLNINKEIRSCIDDEIYYPVEQDTYAINKYDGAYGIIDWMTGQCMAEPMFENIFRLDFVYSVFVQNLLGEKIIILMAYFKLGIEMFSSKEELEKFFEEGQENIINRQEFLKTVYSLPI